MLYCALPLVGLGTSRACCFKERSTPPESRSSPRLPARFQSWHVREGDQVRKGQLLVCLENPELQARLDQTRAAAESEPSTILPGSVFEDLSVQSNGWVRAKAIADQAQYAVERSRGMQAAGVISQQEFQALERDLDEARNSQKLARANFELAKALCDEVERLAVAVKHQRATQAAKELESSAAELSLTSPIDGEVQRLIVDQGACVTSGSAVASVFDLRDEWIRFDVPEDMLGNARTGSTFCVRVPSLGNQEVLVRVSFIALAGKLAPSRHADRSGRLTQNIFEVRAVPVQATEGLRPGTSVVADWGRFN